LVGDLLIVIIDGDFAAATSVDVLIDESRRCVVQVRQLQSHAGKASPLQIPNFIFQLESEYAI
jgi:hypothetical protein